MCCKLDLVCCHWIQKANAIILYIRCSFLSMLFSILFIICFIRCLQFCVFKYVIFYELICCFFVGLGALNITVFMKYLLV